MLYTLSLLIYAAIILLLIDKIDLQYLLASLRRQAYFIYIHIYAKGDEYMHKLSKLDAVKIKIAMIKIMLKNGIKIKNK